MLPRRLDGFGISRFEKSWLGKPIGGGGGHSGKEQVNRRERFCDFHNFGDFGIFLNVRKKKKKQNPRWSPRPQRLRGNFWPSVETQ